MVIYLGKNKIDPKKEINFIISKSNELIPIDEITKKTKLPESRVIKILKDLNAIYTKDKVIPDHYVSLTIKKLNNILYSEKITNSTSIKELSEMINIPSDALTAIVLNVVF